MRKLYQQIFEILLMMLFLFCLTKSTFSQVESFDLPTPQISGIAEASFVPAPCRTHFAAIRSRSCCCEYHLRHSTWELKQLNHWQFLQNLSTSMYLSASGGSQHWKKTCSLGFPCFFHRPLAHPRVSRRLTALYFSAPMSFSWENMENSATGRVFRRISSNVASWRITHLVP